MYMIKLYRITILVLVLVFYWYILNNSCSALIHKTLFHCMLNFVIKLTLCVTTKRLDWPHILLTGGTVSPGRRICF